MIRIIALGAVLSGVIAGTASAATVTLTFGGQVGLGLGSIDSSDMISGSVTYDTSVAARAGSDSNFAVFDAVTDFSYSVGSLSGTFMSATGGPEVQIDNDPGAPNHDRFGVVSRVGDGLSAAMLDGLWNLTGVSFRVDDTTDSVFSDALILPASVDFADFTSGEFFLFFEEKSTGAFALISGAISSLSTVPPPSVVPLPAGLPLSLGALAALGLFARRRRG